jgi:hypothetical protein
MSSLGTEAGSRAAAPEAPAPRRPPSAPRSLLPPLSRLLLSSAVKAALRAAPVQRPPAKLLLSRPHPLRRRLPLRQVPSLLSPPRLRRTKPPWSPLQRFPIPPRPLNPPRLSHPVQPLLLLRQLLSRPLPLGHAPVVREGSGLGLGLGPGRGLRLGPREAKRHDGWEVSCLLMKAFHGTLDHGWLPASSFLRLVGLC